jgi:phosphate starvation-inducible membrane PsiE
MREDHLQPTLTMSLMVSNAMLLTFLIANALAIDDMIFFIQTKRDISNY